MSTVNAHDAIQANVSHLPPGQAAGYTTGSAIIVWTAASWHAHPGAVRICQDVGASDHTADVLDVERGAATNGEAAGWFKAAQTAFLAGHRPGQRSPAIYTSASNVTPLVDALINDGVKSGPGLWVANWNLTQAQAVAEVEAATGPFPVIGVQYSNGQFFDFDVFSSAWLARVSKAKPTVHQHSTSAGDTVATLAASRNMKPGAWLVLQDKLGADAHTLASGPLPAGLTWRSENP